MSRLLCSCWEPRALLKIVQVYYNSGLILVSLAIITISYGDLGPKIYQHHVFHYAYLTAWFGSGQPDYLKILIEQVPIQNHVSGGHTYTDEI